MPSTHLAWNPKHVIVQWIGIGTHTHTNTHTHTHTLSISWKAGGTIKFSQVNNNTYNPSAVCILRRHKVLLIAIRPSDGDVKPGRPPWCFSRRAGYEPAPGSAFSLPFIIIPYNTITLHKQLLIQSP